MASAGPGAVADDGRAVDGLLAAIEADVRQSPELWGERASELVQAIPATVGDIADEMCASGLDQKIGRRQANLIAGRASTLEALLAAWTS